MNLPLLIYFGQGLATRNADVNKVRRNTTDNKFPQGKVSPFKNFTCCWVPISLAARGLLQAQCTLTTTITRGIFTTGANPHMVRVCLDLNADHTTLAAYHSTIAGIICLWKIEIRLVCLVVAVTKTFDHDQWHSRRFYLVSMIHQGKSFTVKASYSCSISES